MLKIKRISIFDFLYVVIGIPWLFMMIITSRGFTEFKMIMLFLLSIISCIEAIILNKKLDKKELTWLLLFLGYYALSLMIGIFRGYAFSFSNDFALIQYYFITPVLALLISYIFLNKKYRLQFVLKIIVIIGFVMVFLNLTKILSYRIGTPDIDVLNLIIIASNNTDTELAIRTSNEASLMFLLPIIIVLFFDKRTAVCQRLILGLIIILGIAYCLLSGRKMLEIVVFGTIMFMLFKELNSKQFKRILHVIEFVLIVIVLCFVVGKLSGALDIDNILERAVETLLNGFSSNSYGVSKRANNTKALLSMWGNYPLFGNGLNAYAADSLASYDTKWSYEVLYVALLAQVGLIGALLLFVGIFYIINKLYRNYCVTNDIWFQAARIGFICFVLCGASNPLVYYIWPWIICLTLVHEKRA